MIDNSTGQSEKVYSDQQKELAALVINYLLGGKHAQALITRINEDYTKYNSNTNSPKKLDQITFTNKQFDEIRELVPPLLQMRLREVTGLTGFEDSAHLDYIHRSSIEDKLRSSVITQAQEKLKNTQDPNLSSEMLLRDLVAKEVQRNQRFLEQENAERYKQKEKKSETQSAQKNIRPDPTRDLIRSIIQGIADGIKSASQLALKSASKVGEYAKTGAKFSLMGVAEMIPATRPFIKVGFILADIIEKRSNDLKSKVNEIKAGESFKDKVISLADYIGSAIPTNGLTVDKVVSKLPIDMDKNLVGKLAGFAIEVDKYFKSKTDKDANGLAASLKDIVQNSLEHNNQGMVNQINVIGDFVKNISNVYGKQDDVAKQKANEFMQTSLSVLSQQFKERAEHIDSTLDKIEATAFSDIADALLNLKHLELKESPEVQQKFQSTVINLHSILNNMKNEVNITELIEKGERHVMPERIERLFQEANVLQQHFQKSPAIKEMLNDINWMSAKEKEQNKEKVDLRNVINDFLETNLKEQKDNVLSYISDKINSLMKPNNNQPSPSPRR